MSADSVTAAERLRTLDTYHRTPIRGAASVRAAPASLPAVPLDLGMLDYLEKTTADLDRRADADAKAARVTNPTVRIAPRPANVADRYEWWESIPVSDEARELERTSFIYRQGLEHAIREGDTKVVRRHPCPACGCYTLFWRPMEKQAACLNRRCTDRNGMSRTWGLALIADRHILAQRSLTNSATS